MEYRISDAKVAWRVVDGEGVLLHADTSAYYGLNRTGTVLWKELAERGLNKVQLTQWAQIRFPDVSPTQLGNDLAEFLDQLRAHDLLGPGGGMEQEKEPIGPNSSRTGEAEGMTYEPPRLIPFGELEKLILSGE